MCGIIGYVGNKKTIDVLIEGLKTLEYRGYDSAGLSVVLEKRIITKKCVGYVSNLENIVKKIKNLRDDKIKVGIAHTRWATHGGINNKNSHPHCVGNITLVHNGIVENYNELRESLINEGYNFVSETDTEVAAALINKYYNGNNPLEAIEKSVKMMRGNNAFVILFKDDTENIYAYSNGSPLTLGKGRDENLIVSDMAALLKHTNCYSDLSNGETAVINKNEIKVYRNEKEVEKQFKITDLTIEDAEKSGYEHFMLKEINEQGQVLDKILSKYTVNGNFSEDVIDLKEYDKIDIVACGSAYYAGLIGKHLMEQYLGNVTVRSEVASEYLHLSHNYYDEKTLVIVLSQSGNTIDTLECLRMAQCKDVDTLAIVNVMTSRIANESLDMMPMLAGIEISVATTKGYFSQVALMQLLTLKLMEAENKVSAEERRQIIEDLKNLKGKIDKLINNDSYKKVAKQLYEKDNIYFIGRGIDYITSLEASLKLKEISYIHSASYQAGELKHGPIATIDKDMPVIAIMTEEMVKEKMISNIVEAKTRGARIILVTTEDMEINESIYDEIIRIPKVHEFNQSLINIVPFQLLAYEIAKAKGCNVDKPRNLAKSVTVV